MIMAAVMSAKLVKIGLSVVVLGAALAVLLRSTLAEGTAYYIHVDEVMKQLAARLGAKNRLGHCWEGCLINACQ